MYGIINKTNVQNVKITMIDRLLSHIAPHYCYQCGKIGSILCDYCKYDIIEDDFFGCVVCGALAVSNGVCPTCVTIFSKGWCVGERTDILRKIIDDYKFERVYEAHKTLAELLAARLPILPSDCVIVPIPTIPSHIRWRGYDQVALISRTLARLQYVKTEPLLKRRVFSVQRGQTKVVRHKQAEQAFTLNGPINGKTVLLIDDIATTGATLTAAGRLLREAGAKELWVATIARQPLD